MTASDAGLILAIETSCDDTCAAVVTRDGDVLSNVISSQGVHDRYGGVVPEIASRHHLELAGAVVDDALQQAGATLPQLDAVAVTQGPGSSARCSSASRPARRWPPRTRSRSCRSTTSTATSPPRS